MDMDQDLEELKGDVDFDFFDSPGKERSPSPRDKKTSEKISSKPPPAPKSPKPDSPVDIGEYENKRTSNPRSNGPREGKVSLFKVIKQEDEDIYSSDSDHTSSQSDSSSFSDVSSVRSGGRARNRSRSSSKTRSPSTSPDQRYTRSKITRKEHSRSDRDNRKTRSRSESVSSQSASESGSESTSDFSDRSPSPTPRNKHEKKYKDISPNPVHKVEERPRVARTRPVSAHPSKKQGGSKHQAWGAGNKNNSFRNSDSSHKNKSRYRTEDSDRSGSDSESDMTDVSPLTSPRNSPHKKRYDHQNGSHKKTVQYCGIPPDLENSSYSIRPGEAETLDLNILMKAVSELEKKKRVKDNTRRVMFAPPKSHDRGNYTFTDDRTKLIERENQRLLREIMKHVAEQRAPHQMKRAEPTPVRRVTASAINRQRQQKTIESENMKFLQRLQKVKPTRGMSRDDQIGHYQRTMLYGVPIAGDDHLKSGRRSRPGSAGSTLSQRSRSMCSVASGSTNASAASTMRSAASTMRSGRIPGSAKRIVESRPCWSDRW